MDLLTIVIPTRDRPDYLEKCLKSIFECQLRIPSVIVSDNSTSDQPAIEALRRNYPFTYVRQSGKLSMTDHHNACLELPSTLWVLLLHDDDELCPNILNKLESFLAKCEDVGIVVGGIQHIDQQGHALKDWIPRTTGTFRGEDGLLRLGLDFQACPPGWICNVAALHQVGGFPDANGASADYPLTLRLAYSYGVAFFPEIVGRYRSGPHQATDYSTPERAEATLDCSIRMAQLTRTIGCSASVADQLVDYMTWWIFWIIAGRWLASHPFFVSRMCRKCALASPSHGPWKNRVKGEYPFLFWRPQWLALLLYKAARAFLPAPVKRRLRQYSPGLLKATKALLRYLFESIRGILPRPAKRVAKQVLTFINGFMVRVRLGVSVLPLSYLWGFDRGLPIHRYYLQEFLQEFASDIRGHCLEFQDAAYTPRFGGSAVAKLDILHIDDRNQSATIVADLTKSNDIPSNIFDCIVCTHVLHVIFELNKAVKELYRVLKPGGVLLVTVPHVSMCDPGSKEIWRFTPDGLYLVLAQVFGEPNVTVRAYGNSLTAAGEIRGLVAHEFVKGELDHHDSRFAVEVCARAIKPGLS